MVSYHLQAHILCNDPRAWGQVVRFWLQHLLKVVPAYHHHAMACWDVLADLGADLQSKLWSAR